MKQPFRAFSVLLKMPWLAGIVESCEDAILSQDLEGVITSSSAGAQRLSGYAPAGARGA
jgi:PAS domain S-box-containing protein